MAVYVDDMQAPYGTMRMCHMIADTDAELHAMAEVIGVQRRWHQAPPRVRYSHYDICLSKRQLAILYGAIPITMREAALMCQRRRLTGTMGRPEEARKWKQTEGWLKASA